MKKTVNIALTPVRAWIVGLGILVIGFGAPLYLSTIAVHNNTVHGVIGKTAAAGANITEPTGIVRKIDNTRAYMGTVLKRNPAPLLPLNGDLVLLLTASYLLGLAGLTRFALRCEPSDMQVAMAVAPSVVTLGFCLGMTGFTHAAFLALTFAVTAYASGVYFAQFVRQSNATVGTTGGVATTEMSVASPGQALAA